MRVTSLDGTVVKLWRALAGPSIASSAPAGSIVTADASGVVVACGEGVLRITELQPAGGRRMGAAAFLAGRRIAPGARFDPHPA